MQLLIPAKIPQRPAHMCGTLYTHLAAKQTPPLAAARRSLKHTYVFVSKQQRRKAHPGVYCTASLAGLLVQRVLSMAGVQQTEANCGQAQSWAHRDTV